MYSPFPHVTAYMVLVLVWQICFFFRLLVCHFMQSVCVCLYGYASVSSLTFSFKSHQQRKENYWEQNAESQLYIIRIRKHRIFRIHVHNLDNRARFHIECASIDYFISFFFIYIPLHESILSCAFIRLNEINKPKMTKNMEKNENAKLCLLFLSRKRRESKNMFTPVFNLLEASRKREW